MPSTVNRQVNPFPLDNIDRWVKTLHNATIFRCKDVHHTVNVYIKFQDVPYNKCVSGPVNSVRL